MPITPIIQTESGHKVQVVYHLTSPFSLYSEEIATFNEDHVYDQKDSAGFINLFGLPIAARAQLLKGKI